MSNRENQEGFNPFTLAAAVLSICGVAAALMLMPAEATSEGSAASTATYAGNAGYLPAQYVNQGPQTEPVQHFSYE